MKTSELMVQSPEAISSEIIHSLVINGDLSKMSSDQKVDYYNRFCQSLGLNSLTQPFQLITFQGKLKLYATKDCTEQLRKIHGVSITDVAAAELRGVYVVTAKARDKEGKTDAATGVVHIDNLKGEALANALMKAETKAKRRVTLSICGLGILDESETDSIGQHTVASIADVLVEKMHGDHSQDAEEMDYITPAIVRDAPLTATKLNNDKTRKELAETEYKEPVFPEEFKPVTINQKTQILLLLNHSTITKEEKEKMVAKINTFDTVRGDQAIAKLKKVIKDRTADLPSTTKAA